MEKRVIPASERLEVWSQEGDFAEGIAALQMPDASQQKPSLELITAEQLAIIRMRDGPASPFSTQGTWVAENYNYGNGRGADIVIASGSFNPLLKQPVEATSAHQKGKEFYLDDAVWKQLRSVAESDPYKAINSGALLVTRESLRPEIPVEALGETEETIFLFRGQAKVYGDWLKKQSISSVPQWTIDAAYASGQHRSFGRALWVRNLGGWSGLVGGNHVLHINDGRVRGVSVVPAERAAPGAPQEAKVVKPTLEQVLAITAQYVAPVNAAALEQQIAKLYGQK